MGENYQARTFYEIIQHNSATSTVALFVKAYLHILADEVDEALVTWNSILLKDPGKRQAAEYIDELKQKGHVFRGRTGADLVTHYIPVPLLELPERLPGIKARSSEERQHASPFNDTLPAKNQPNSSSDHSASGKNPNPDAEPTTGDKNTGGEYIETPDSLLSGLFGDQHYPSAPEDAPHHLREEEADETAPLITDSLEEDDASLRDTLEATQPKDSGSTTDTTTDSTTQSTTEPSVSPKPNLPNSAPTNPAQPIETEQDKGFEEAIATPSDPAPKSTQTPEPEEPANRREPSSHKSQPPDIEGGVLRQLYPESTGRPGDNQQASADEQTKATQPGSPPGDSPESESPGSRLEDESRAPKEPREGATAPAQTSPALAGEVVQTEAETEAETEVQTEAETEVQTEAETEVETEAEAETEADPAAQREAPAPAEEPEGDYDVIVIDEDGHYHSEPPRPPRLRKPSPQQERPPGKPARPPSPGMQPQPKSTSTHSRRVGPPAHPTPERKQPKERAVTVTNHPAGNQSQSALDSQASNPLTRKGRQIEPASESDQGESAISEPVRGQPRTGLSGRFIFGLSAAIAAVTIGLLFWGPGTKQWHSFWAGDGELPSIPEYYRLMSSIADKNIVIEYDDPTQLQNDFKLVPELLRANKVNRARYLLNKIIYSNADYKIRERASLFSKYIPSQNWTNFSDFISPDELAENPVLYQKATVLFRGNLISLSSANKGDIKLNGGYFADAQFEKKVPSEHIGLAIDFLGEYRYMLDESRFHIDVRQYRLATTTKN